MTPAELRAWREHWFYTQTSLARALGVHIDTVGGWERGKREIPAYLDLALETLANRRAAEVRQRAAAVAGPPVPRVPAQPGRIATS